MRRGSLVGPLLIILIGVWFLISSLRPDLPLLDVAARFWPFLLIGWGVLRLFELFVWRMRGRPLPYSGISGGEWTAIVFISLIGYGLFQVKHHAPWQLIRSNRLEIFGHSYDFPVEEKKVAADKMNRLLVENLYGTIRVIGADAKEISVGGRKTIRALQEKEAEGASQLAMVEVAAQGEQMVVRTNQDRITGEERLETHLEITVPRNIAVEVRGRRGDIEVSSVRGPVDITSDNAGVRLDNISDKVRLDLRRSDLVRVLRVKGPVELIGGRGRDVEMEEIAGEVTINGSFSGDLELRNLAKPVRLQSASTELRVESVPGHIHMDLGDFSATDVVGPVKLSTSGRSRDVQLERFTNAVEIALDRGNVVLRPAQAVPPRIGVQTRFGDIEIALPESAKFQLKGTTNRGEVNNDFGPALSIESSRWGSDREDRHHGGTITGATGQGAQIVLHTDRGMITVRRDTGAALPSTPDTGHPEPPRPPRPPAEPVQSI
jgi:DUF4097 and DUF4098 domain-containing protein YvlB